MIDNIRKYNLWDKNTHDLGFLRIEYTKRIGLMTGNNLVKVLIGQRRAGKSYVLRQIANQLVEQGVNPRNILYVNKEYLEYGEILTAEDLQNLYDEYKKALKPKGKVYLFLDEIQLVKNWERFVNSHSQDFTEEQEIFISGSNSDLLSGELASLLSGRYVEFEILPYSFEEYTDMLQLAKDKSSYLQFLQQGMLPELFHLTNDEMKRHYVSSVKDTIMLRDIVRRYNVKDTQLLEDIFRYLVNNAGRMISISNITNYFKSLGRKTNYETVSSYADYLCKAFLIHKAERYNVAGKELLNGNCKYYANDSAYYNYLYKGFAYGLGNLLENAVYIELRRKGWQLYVGVQGQTEIDFVAMRSDEKVYFQVSWQIASNEETAQREYAPLLALNDHFRKYVVTLDDYRFPSNNGIEHIFPWEINNIL